LLTTLGSLSRTFQDAFKKATETAEKRRAIRGGTAVSIIFGLVIGTVAFARHHRDVPQTPAATAFAAPTPDASVPQPQAASLPNTRASQKRHGKSSAETPKPADEPVVVTVQDGQTLGGVGLRYLGQAGPVTTKKIQESNPEITDPNRIYAGSQIRLPAAAVRAESASPATSELPNRTEEQR
jgi:hypothetical protein